MGWQSVAFFVTPEELEKVLEPFWLVTDNACVPLGYTHTPAGEFLKGYAALYQLLTRGQTPGAEHRALLRHTAFTSDLAGVRFGREHLLGGEWVKSVLHDRTISPMPYLSPFTLMARVEKGNLYVSTRASYLAYPEFVCGYEVHFRRFSRGDAAYYGLASEKEFSTYRDYAQFKRSIAEITRPLCIRLQGAEKKTSIRVSDAAKPCLAGLHCIAGRGVEIL